MAHVGYGGGPGEGTIHAFPIRRACFSFRPTARRGVQLLWGELAQGIPTLVSSTGPRRGSKKV